MNMPKTLMLLSAGLLSVSAHAATFYTQLLGDVVNGIPSSTNFTIDKGLTKNGKSLAIPITITAVSAAYTAPKVSDQSPATVEARIENDGKFELVSLVACGEPSKDCNSSATMLNPGIKISDEKGFNYLAMNRPGFRGGRLV